MLIFIVDFKNKKLNEKLVGYYSTLIQPCPNTKAHDQLAKKKIFSGLIFMQRKCLGYSYGNLYVLVAFPEVQRITKEFFGLEFKLTGFVTKKNEQLRIKTFPMLKKLLKMKSVKKVTTLLNLLIFLWPQNGEIFPCQITSKMKQFRLTIVYKNQNLISKKYFNISEKQNVLPKAPIFTLRLDKLNVREQENSIIIISWANF